MKRSDFNFGPRGVARFAALLVVATCALASGGAAWAQSGRRPPRPQEIAPVPTPTPEPVAPKKSEPEDTKIPVLVLAGEASYFYSSRLTLENILAVTVVRLRESKSLVVTGEERRAGRSEAIKRAKAEVSRRVVWLELRVDQRADVGIRRPPPEYYQIDYTVFSPATGNVEAAGSVQLRRAYGPLGQRPLPSCYPRTTTEQEFIVAAIEAAERIIKSLSLSVPPRCG